MTFTIQGGSVDIQAGDYVHASPYCIESGPDSTGLASANWYQVGSVSGENSTQIQINYITPTGSTVSIWLDALWISAVLRPQTIS